jgi:alpha-1,6-mannosyltransferase
VSRRRFFGLLGCGLVLLALTASGLYAQYDDNIDGFVALALAQGAVYVVALRLIRDSTTSRRSLALILSVAAAMRIAVLAAPPFLSSDVYRYVWDGRVLAAGINPYRYIPTDPHLAPLRDGVIFPNINRSNYAPTIYPPAAEAIFFAVTRISESVAAMKIAMVLFEAIATGLLLCLLASAGLPAVRIIVYAWHPLPVWEFAGSGHIDAAIIGFTALALWSRVQPVSGAPLPSFRGRRSRSPEPINTDRSESAPTIVRRFQNAVFMGSGLGTSRRPGMTYSVFYGWLTGLALAAGTLVKFYPAVLFPALWRRWEWHMPAVFAAAVLLAYLPFLGVGWGVFGFLPGYLAEEGFTSGGGFYLWSMARAALPLGGVADIAYLIAAACLLALLAIYVTFRRFGGERDVFGAALLAGAFVVLLSPHYAWYFAWLIVFACLTPSAALLWLTLASFLLYLVPVGSQLVRDHHRFLVETALYVPFLALTALDLWRREQLRHGDKRG